jgi:hypothetical protein
MTSSRVAAGAAHNLPKLALHPAINFPRAFSLSSFLFPLFSFLVPKEITTTFLAMSAEILTQLFIGETRNPWLDEMLRQQMAEAAALEPALNPSGCLFTDMGEFLVRATNILSRVANGVVHDQQRITKYIDKKAREMREDHDFSKLSPLVYMNEKHTCLKFATVDRSLSYSVLTP